NANMVKGMAGSSIQKGFDPRDFTLVAFGGAGPLHACELAREIGMRRVVIPLYPGALSAFGLVTSDIRHDYVQTIARAAATLAPEALEQAYRAMEEKARRQLQQEKIDDDVIAMQWSADLRYAGQAYELNVPMGHNGHLDRQDIETTLKRFHALHQKIYAYDSPAEPVEWINARLVGIGRVPPVKLPRRGSARTSPRAGSKRRRPVYFEGRGYRNVPVYERELIQPGQVLKGPCLIEEVISSTVVTPHSSAQVDKWGNLIIDV
ncbi:MAG TPA: hydantoinase/oxoprolinase family protein, partial [Anaerolineae bacterium]